MENVGVSKNYMLIQKIKSAGCFIVCLLLAAVCIVPLWIMVCNATHDRFFLSTNPINFIPGGDFSTNFYNISKGEMAQFPDFNVWTGYLNSLIIAGCSTVLTVFFSALTSYGLTVYNFKVRDTAYTIILAVMMIPVQVTSTGFVQFMVGTLGLANSYIPLILPAIAAPAVVFYMRQYMKSSFPLDIVEAARIDGAGRMQVIRHIYLAHLKPIIAINFLMKIGALLSIGFEKVYLLQNPLNMETSSILATYAYDIGLVGGQYSYSAAVGLFDNIINLILVVLANYIVKKVSSNEVGLW